VAVGVPIERVDLEHVPVVLPVRGVGLTSTKPLPWAKHAVPSASPGVGPPESGVVVPACATIVYEKPAGSDRMPAGSGTISPYPAVRRTCRAAAGSASAPTLPATAMPRPPRAPERNRLRRDRGLLIANQPPQGRHHLVPPTQVARRHIRMNRGTPQCKRTTKDPASPSGLSGPAGKAHRSLTSDHPGPPDWKPATRRRTVMPAPALPDRYDRAPEYVGSPSTVTVARIPGYRPLRLDLRRPATDGAVPVVVWIHGGGWRKGGRGLHVFAAEEFHERVLRRGYAVADVEYRLSREAVFPAQLLDVKAALRWLRAFAPELGLDADRFVAWGESAGGHLAALAGLVTDPALEGDAGVVGTSSAVQAVVDWYGPADMALFLDDDRTAQPAGSAEEWLLGGPLAELPAQVAAASPTSYVRPDAPPFVLLHGTADTTVPYRHSEVLAAALRDAGRARRAGAGTRCRPRVRGRAGHRCADRTVARSPERRTAPGRSRPRCRYRRLESGAIVARGV
jgi:acetyl esterase/lipase